LVCPESGVISEFSEITSSAVKKGFGKVFNRRQPPEIIDGLKRNGFMPNILMKVSGKHGW
jgi:hypothetical protein